MLIFDRFSDKRKANGFAKYVRKTFKRRAQVFDSQEESDKVDIFPFKLDPPIVLVERDDLRGGPELEPQIEAAVKSFDGAFAGT